MLHISTKTLTFAFEYNKKPLWQVTYTKVK